MTSKGILLVLSGFSGSGKGTVLKELMKKYDNYVFSVSATTRTPRKGEQDGVDYFFVTKERFNEMIENDELVEHACYVGNYYGTPRKYVEDMLAEGKNVILDIEVQGALNIKSKYPDALLMFVMPPSVREIERRLINRNTEDIDVIRKRMLRGAVEIGAVSEYDYLVVNDNLDECVERMHNTVISAGYATKRNKEFIDEIKKQFEDYVDEVQGQIN